MSLYFLVAQPKDNNLQVGNDQIPQTSVGNGLGGGLKIGTYFGHLRSIPGIELDLFGHTGSADAPRTTEGGVIRFSNTKLTIGNTMVNVLLRYPGKTVQPYIGIGGGLSIANSDGDIRSRNMFLSGGARTAHFAYQLLAGIRTNMTDRVFVFAEYKYFDTHYQWGIENSGDEVTLRFQTHYVNTGIGIRF